MATKVQASGPETVGVWIVRGYLLWRKYSDDRLKKLTMSSSSDQPKYERTNSMTQPKCSRLLKMK
jgi:hypothetical protein